MIAWIDMGICICSPFVRTALSKAMATWDSFCSLLRGWDWVTCPRPVVALGTRMVPALLRRSCVTLATTSSPCFAFLASMLLASCTGITLPGEIRGAFVAGAVGAVAWAGVEDGACCAGAEDDGGAAWAGAGAS